MFRAVVFDFDGLILDTETSEFRSFQDVFEKHGAVLELDVWKDCIGTSPSAFDPYRYLEQCIGRPVDRELARAWRKERFEQLMKEESVRPGVESYLRRATELGLKIGLASSSTRAWVEGYLRQFHLLHYFHCIRTRDDVVRVKPDPELYLRALEELGVAPAHAVAFEDSPNGALAAKRAGMACVIVPNPLTETLIFGEVDLRLSSMAEMSLDEVIARLEESRR